MLTGRFFTTITSALLVLSLATPAVHTEEAEVGRKDILYSCCLRD